MPPRRILARRNVKKEEQRARKSPSPPQSDDRDLSEASRGEDSDDEQEEYELSKTKLRSRKIRSPTKKDVSPISPKGKKKSTAKQPQAKARTRSNVQVEQEVHTGKVTRAKSDSLAKANERRKALQSKQKVAAPKKKQPKPKLTKRLKNLSDGGDDVSSSDAADSENDQSSSDYEGSDSEDSDTETYEEAPRKRRVGQKQRPTMVSRGTARRRSQRNKSSRVKYQSEDSDSEDNFEAPVNRNPTRERRSSDVPDDSPRRPCRASAARATTRMAMLRDEEDKAVDIIQETKKKIADQDDDFVMSDQDEDSDEEQGDEGDSVNLDESLSEGGNVDNEDFLTADSSGDEHAGPSPMLNLQYSGRKAKVFMEVDSDSSSCISNQKLKSSPPALPAMHYCPSRVDAITLDTLPSKHVCYIVPDLQSRLCFSLETLHKIAMTSAIRDHRGQHIFLQPPHFRTVMSEDLEDQIASRFGRAALDIHGDFYKSQGEKGDGAEDSRQGSIFDYMVNFDGSLADSETFHERFLEYMSTCMGSRDIYCCPLCYVEAHRRLEKLTTGRCKDSGDDEDSLGTDADEKSMVVTLWHDPMTVLGFVDNDKFEVAAGFCFAKIADVKRHLREDHDVDVSILDGNDLFPRFKVRASDGLLQRFVEKSFRGRTFQGDMRRYWSTGNNQTFIYLLHLMERFRLVKSKVKDGEEISEESMQLLSAANVYFRSFEKRAKRTWEVVSSPYQKAIKAELNDFIVYGDVDEEEGQPHYVFESGIDPEEEILALLKKKKQKQKGRLKHDESEDDGSERGEDSSEAERSSFPSDIDEGDLLGLYSEEEDELVVSSRPVAKIGSKGTPLSGTREKTPSGVKRLGNGGTHKSMAKSGDVNEAANLNTEPSPASKVRRIIVDDSDSE